jgi:hypothetical protein
VRIFACADQPDGISAGRRVTGGVCPVSLVPVLFGVSSRPRSTGVRPVKFCAVGHLHQRTASKTNAAALIGPKTVDRDWKGEFTHSLSVSASNTLSLSFALRSRSLRSRWTVFSNFKGVSISTYRVRSLRNSARQMGGGADRRRREEMPLAEAAIGSGDRVP